ncbi:MAG: pyridoxal 5'-phosphate synthase glutaminase subunit PdxT [Butyricicoccaceae bacterium]
MSKQIGILAVQGAFIEHAQALHKLGVSSYEIRQASDLTRPMDGLILPGGESTSMGKLIRELGLFDELKRRIQSGMPVFGTCAGLLLLAEHIDNDERRHFATMHISARRNAYGRQLGSFLTEAEMSGIGTIPMTFIRAPYIESVSGDARVLATVGGNIVAAQEHNQLVTAFHPELNDRCAVHEYFCSLVG